jgi:Predicted dehydrogenases and related proteins
VINALALQAQGRARLIAEAKVDTVAIATPLHTHAELAITALRAGAGVLLEKPPVTDLTDFARVSEA